MVTKSSKSGRRLAVGVGSACALIMSGIVLSNPAVTAAPEASGAIAQADNDDDDLAIVSDTLVSVTPARFVDTRPGFATIDGVHAGEGKRPADSEYEITVAGRDVIPADAAAVVVNVTAVSPEGRGYVTLHPCVSPRPLASSLNYVAGVNTGNEVVAALSTDGSICAYTNRVTHLTIDVVGYVPATGEISPLVPARLLDTRAGGATVDGEGSGAGRTTAGSSLTVQVAGRGGVPADEVHSVLVNVTAVDPQERGFVVAHACLPAVPSTSSLNHVPGVNRGNELLVELSAAGEICLFTNRGVHLTVDVVSYILTGSTVATVAPSRLADSRPGNDTVDGIAAGFGKSAGGTQYTLQVTGRAGVPADAQAAIVNVTAVAPEARGYFTVHPCVPPRPIASSINYTAGVNGANELIAGLSPTGALCIFTSSNAHFTVDVVGYIANSAAPMADLSVTVSDSVDPANAGDPLTSTVTVTNTGPADAENVRVTSVLADDVTVVSTDGCDEDPAGESTCTLGDIANGTSEQFTILTNIASDAPSGPITNTATVTSDTADPVGGNNTATEATTIQAVGTIIIEKTTEPVGGTGFGFTDDIAAPNTFTLDAGQATTFTTVSVGTYSVTEDDPSPQNLVSISCDDGASPTASTGSTITRTATIGLDPGETVTCVFLNNLNLAPTIISDGGGNNAEIDVDENQTAVTDVNSTDDLDSEGAGLTYSLSGGDDQALFTLDTTTGVLAFATPPDFENATDTDADGTYDVQTTVTDAGPGTGLTDVQDIAITVDDVNEAPVITSNGGGATAAVNAAENQTAVTDVQSADPEGDTEGAGLTYSLSGGDDQALFTLDTTTGVLAFATPPDFENATDTDADGTYDVQVTVTDSGTLTDVQDVAVTVTGTNDDPVITSDGGGATASVNAAENQTAVTTVTATDPDVPAQTLAFSITGGADQALFGLAGGVLTFDAAPDFEIPGDAGGNNVYDVQVTVTDDGTGALTDVQDIAVTVTDVNENPVITSDGGGATASVNAAENQTAVTTVTATDPDVPAQTLRVLDHRRCRSSTVRSRRRGPHVRRRARLRDPRRRRRQQRVRRAGHGHRRRHGRPDRCARHRRHGHRRRLRDAADCGRRPLRGDRQRFAHGAAGQRCPQQRRRSGPRRHRGPRSRRQRLRSNRHRRHRPRRRCGLGHGRR